MLSRFLACLLALCAATVSAAERKPNVILIMADGRVNGNLIGSVDFFPTLVELAKSPAAGAAHPDGHSFLGQLLGRPDGKPREWLYSWYSRAGGKQPEWEYAMSTTHKLYRDGRFFDLTADPYEAKPALKVAALTGPAAAKSLQSALDQFNDARPAHLSEVGNGPGQGKNKAGKGKNKNKEKE